MDRGRQVPAEQHDFDLARFSAEQSNVIRALHANPRTFAATMYQEKTSGVLGLGDKETFSPYLGTNEQSLCCMVGKTDVKLEDQPKICAYAEVDKFTDGGREGETYTVKVRKTYVIKSREVPSLFIRYSEEPSATLKVIQGQRNEMAMCMYRDITVMKFLASDSFTNEMLIGFLINTIYQQSGSKYGLNGYIKHYSATICNQGRRTYGINFLEYADQGDFTQFINDSQSAAYLEPLTVSEDGKSFRLQTLTASAVIDVVKQIAANLVFVQEVAQFNHSDLKMANVLVSTERTAINYKGMSHTSDLSFKLADFGKSSMSANLEVGKVRIYSRLATADIYFAAVGFKPKVGTKYNEAYYEVETYITIRLLAQLRHMGIPFYHSWDTYTFLLSFLMIPSVFYRVFTDPRLKAAIWDPMWFPEESSKMFTQLQSAVQKRKDPSYDNVVSILKGSKLKCRGTEIFFESVKTL